MAPDIAQQLWDARHDGRTVSADALGVIADYTAAYALQTAVTTLSGAVVIGWKLGATSAASRKAFGLRGPFYGPLLAPFDQRAQLVAVRERTMAERKSYKDTFSLQQRSNESVRKEHARRT